MSENQEMNLKIAELIGGLNNLATELKHYVDVHESHKSEMKERFDKIEIANNNRFTKIEAKHDKLDDKVDLISSQMPLLNDMKESQKMMTKAVLSIAGAIIVMVIVGGLLAFKGVA